ncbi:MAG: hypothetical protein KJZ78_27735, partial [Bryobacteraceae bacterium]|nr:hypothetical protein [Bryobacteraceae bacterium]
SETKYADIYRYGSFDTLRTRLVHFLGLCRAMRNPPVVDLAFVAMDRNLEELSSVAAFAAIVRISEQSYDPPPPGHSETGRKYLL